MTDGGQFDDTIQNNKDTVVSGSVERQSSEREVGHN